MSEVNEADIRRMVHEEVEQVMLYQVLPIVSEQIVAMEHRLEEKLKPVAPIVVDPPTLRLVDRNPHMRHLSIEDEFYLMDQAEGQ